MAEKAYVGKDIIHVAVYLKNDKRTIYNEVYSDGRAGAYYIKRFAVSSVTRDKEYDLTKGAPNSKIVYFTANANGEAETIKVTLRPTTRRIKNLVFEKDFSEIAIKGRQSMGNILTKFDVHKILLKQKGGSTLGGTPIWFDADVLRLNIDKRGQYIGEFFNDDMILVITKNGDFYTTNFDLNNHYDDDILRIEKFDVGKVWSAALYDAEQGFAYLKRFTFEVQKNRTSFIGDSKLSRLFALSDQVYPRFRVTLGGGDSFREPFEVDGETFIAVKSYKAKGKRLTTWTVENVEELEPLRMPADKPTADAAQPDGETPQTATATEQQPENVSVDTTKNDDADTQHIEIVTIDTTRNDTDTTAPSDGDDIDEITGQLTLF